MSAEQIQLINDDYSGKVNNLRHASRGILIKDGKVLISYESLNDKCIIPILPTTGFTDANIWHWLSTEKSIPDKQFNRRLHTWKNQKSTLPISERV